MPKARKRGALGCDVWDMVVSALPVHSEPHTELRTGVGFGLVQMIGVSRRGRRGAGSAY